MAKSSDLSRPCVGPCLSHCYCSRTVAGLAYVALAYLGASVLYLGIVALMRFGTPFKDSLSTEQQCIMRTSKRNRGTAFGVGLLVMAIVLVATRPFNRR